jgi:NADH:ubiquinone oxidoreductase subunit 5 (subunit L)/multisubunit Na+/H+ antiporter MnhA subunit
MLLGAVAIVMGAFLAIFQDDIKLMLAYSTISNVGYIVLGFGWRRRTRSSAPRCTCSTTR